MCAPRDFARGLAKEHGELSLLVNNAGANYLASWSTEEGVPGLIQVHVLDHRCRQSLPLCSLHHPAMECAYTMGSQSPWQVLLPL